MGTEQMLAFSVESMVEDVLKQHGTRLSDRDLASRKAEEASLRRSEAAGWLRKTVGVVGGKDLPAEPSEEEFRLALRSGIILCHVLNKVQPGAIPKVVEGPGDSVIIPDGAALSAYQYFENVRNFLVAIEDMCLPTFEASDMEQGGKSCRIVNSVLALKSYSEWKQGGGHGSWKFGGNLKPTSSGKYFIRKNSEAFMNSFSRSSSASEKFLESLTAEQSFTDDLGHELNEASKSGSLHTLVHQILSDKRQEDIPLIVESMLTKVMQEFECRLSSQNGALCQGINTSLHTPHERRAGRKTVNFLELICELESICCLKCNEQGGMKVASKTLPEEHFNQVHVTSENFEGQQLKQRMLVEQQDKDIQVLKNLMSSTKSGMQFLQAKYMEDISVIGKHLHSVANAASGYQKVLEENRRLYNQVQDLKGNIRVYCRVRPFLSGQSNRPSTVDRIDDGNISIITSLKNGKEGRKSFTFNKVYGPSASQEEVFLDTKPLVRSILDGYNVCIFAYGQTGSGKTYTMTGPKELTEETVGVNFRALNDLFLLSEQRRDTFSYDVSVQMIEIYNEQVRDLLVTDGQNKKVEIRNSAQNGINVPEANIVPVSSTSDVLYLMNLGLSNRAVSATALNDRSSRSHSCLMVHVQGRELTTGTILRGCMHLVDLAGSERVDKSEVTGDRLKEAQHINKSLSALGDVISSLAQKNSHVPYRNSKLTQLLQDSLGGQAKTLMFVHISPEPDALAETVSTLKFAERVSTVELGAARANKDGVEVKDLKEQIANLKAALARKEGEVEQSYLSRPCSPERLSASPAVASDLSSLGSADMEVTQRQPMGDVGNIEVQNKLTPKPKIQSFDIQDVLFNSPPWPPLSGLGRNEKDDEGESISGEWVDKMIVKKHDGVSRGENPPVIWQADNKELPQMYYQKISIDPSRTHKEKTQSKSTSHRRNNHMNDIQSGRYDAVTDDDELDAGTSDSSEHEMLWQFNASKANKNGPGSKMKKPHPKSAKSQETRSLIPTLIPTPSRKQSNVVNPPLQKPRQTVAVDGRRRNGNVK